MKVQKLSAIIFISMFILSGCSSDYNYTIKGTVYDSTTNLPIEGAKAEFCLRMGDVDSMYTGPDGKFILVTSDNVFNIAGDNSIELNISKEGYIDYIKEKAFEVDPDISNEGYFKIPINYDVEKTITVYLDRIP